jgi:hypothetical protein
MAHYLGEVSGSRGSASRLGTKNSGLTVKAMSWSGMVRVDVTHNDATGEDRFTVEQSQHPSNGAGIREIIAEGVIGQPTKKENGKAELVETLQRIATIGDDEKDVFLQKIREIALSAIKKAEG